MMVERFRCYTEPDGTTDMKPDEMGSWCYYRDYEELATRLDKIRALLKDDEVGEWKELMELVGPASP